MKNFDHPQVKPYLITKSLFPENQETPIHFLYSDIVDGKIISKKKPFFLKTPLYIILFPNLLPIDGLVHAPKIFSLQEIYSLPSKTIKVVLESMWFEISVSYFNQSVW